MCIFPTSHAVILLAASNHRASVLLIVTFDFECLLGHHVPGQCCILLCLFLPTCQTKTAINDRKIFEEGLRTASLVSVCSLL